MAFRRYILDSDSGDELEIEWTGHWNDITVRFNRQTVMTFANGDALISGCEVDLPDGNSVGLSIQQRLGRSDITVEWRGDTLVPVEVDAAMPLFMIHVALLVLAGVDILSGTLAAAFDVGVALAMGFAGYSVLVGFTFVLLALLVRQGSSIALGLSLMMVVGDTIWAFVINRNFAAFYPYLGLALRIAIFVVCLRGLKALRQLYDRHRPPITTFQIKEED